MRLTNVLRMALPQGRMLSYGVRVVGAPGRRFPVSFDQGRHVGLGQRPGSWMAIAARLPEATSLDDLSASWFAVVQRHGTFRTVFSHDLDERLQLHQVEVEPGEWVEQADCDGQDPRRALRALFDRYCQPFESPSHRLALVMPDEAQTDRRPVVIVGSDHAHVDMWSFLVVFPCTLR